jgi:hypothetical protein
VEFSLLLLVIYPVEFRKLSTMQNSANEQPGWSAPKEHYVACMLNPPEAWTDALAASASRAPIGELLEDFVEVGDIPFRPFVTPSLRAVHADLDEVVARAAAQLKAGHASRLRLGRRAARTNVGENLGER